MLKEKHGQGYYTKPDGTWAWTNGKSEDRMSTKDTGGPAFPAMLDDNYGNKFANEGMTLRDYFAAKACAGICASKDEAGVLLAHGYGWIAKESYAIADAMLKARTE